MENLGKSYWILLVYNAKTKENSTCCHKASMARTEYLQIAGCLHVQSCPYLRDSVRKHFFLSHRWSTPTKASVCKTEAARLK